VRALGLDVGSKTIGVAVGIDADHDASCIAMPREVLARTGHQGDAHAVARIAQETRAAVIVVGWPLELDGREGRRARLVGQFIDVLASTLAGAVPIERWDERFSTAAVERVLLEADASRAKRKAVVDALAAQHILQSWLDARARRRGVVEA
jgi:putative Holliday junction resolvase